MYETLRRYVPTSDEELNIILRYAGPVYSTATVLRVRTLHVQRCTSNVAHLTLHAQHRCHQERFLFTTAAKVAMCQQIAAGLAELSANGVVHRDVAARNILVHRVYPIHVKVCDFGLARREMDLPTASPALLPLRYAPAVVCHC